MNLKSTNRYPEDIQFAERIKQVPRSFIREILKVASGNDVISFAGGLPNPKLFPVSEMKEAGRRVFEGDGAGALQYNNSEGYLPLREYIAERYLKKQGFDISPNNILITSGSQQGLDLIGKVFINPGDRLLIEEPGYLGAIQAFSLFQPKFLPVALRNSGINTDELRKIFRQESPKLMYVVPDFQNPSGISYTDRTREDVAKIVSANNILLIEDNPYTEIRFSGETKKSFYHYIPGRTILLGTFSKTTVPGMRLAWIVAPDAIMEKLIIAKQAADLHTNSFSQRLLFSYLSNNDTDSHIQKIALVYGKQCKAMLNYIKEYFPKEVEYTKPEGGMFLWVTMPNHIKAIDLFEKTISRGVAIVPGDPFYIGTSQSNSFRMNFSCADEKTIRQGVKIISKVMYELMSS